MGGTHDHTTAKEFQGNTQALRVVNSFCRGTVKGNCRGNDDLQTMEYENYDLPKRSSSRKRLRTVETPLNEHNTPGKMYDVGISRMKIIHFFIATIDSDSCEILISAVNEILYDDTFQVTPSAIKIREMAELFVAWAKPPHSYLFVHFARILLSTLNYCFKSKKNIQDEKEHMWTRYHILRCSPNFHDAWQNFMSHSIKTEAQPSFYQHVSQTVFTKLIGLRYVAAESSENSSPVR